MWRVLFRTGCSNLALEHGSEDHDIQSTIKDTFNTFAVMSWQVNYVLLLAVILCISSACLTFRPFSLSHYDVWKVLNVETFVFQGFLLSSERGTNLCLQKGLTKSSVPHRMPVVPSVQSDRLYDDPLAWEDTWGRVDTRKKIGIFWVDSLTPSMPCLQHYPPSIAVFNFSACLLQDFLQSAVTFPHKKMFLPWSYNYVEHAKKLHDTSKHILLHTYWSKHMSL